MGERRHVKETFYLFEFDICDTYEMKCAVSFKDAVWEMAKYTGADNVLLRKCLKGFEGDDINGIVEIFNTFSIPQIVKVYQIEKVVYDEKTSTC